jgi:colanic acid/amylovoran biosynthesis glycosyltransferase
MISFFQFFTQKLRLSNPWRYKVPLLIAFCYLLLLAGDVHPLTSAMSFFAAIGTTIGFMGFGYLTNDLADRKKDALAGKSNGTANLSTTSIVLLVITFLAIAILPWIYLPMDEVSVICIVAELALFVLYAFPPFRLKERGIFGVVADALYAHAVPGFLASWTFYLVGDKKYDDFFYFIIVLVAWQFFSGARNIVSHHFKDFENDISSGTKTFATGIGKGRTYTWMKRVFVPLEVSAFLGFLGVAQLEIDFLFVVVILFLFLAWTNYRNGESDTPLKHFTNTFLDRFYIHWFPYVVIFTLIFRNFEFWWLLVFHVLIFHPAVGRITRRFTSKKEEAPTNQEPLVRQYAILSTNRNQYSETFIQAHIRLIDRAIVYSDGYFPTTISLDRGETWEELPKEKDAQSELIESWQKHNVQAVLAEYGPAGAEVMHACAKANIPLIVHFHGFDAYRNDCLNHYGGQYKELFQLASIIVVVSEDMKSQLLSLGCPKDKLELITYGIDADIFSPSDATVERENFIAVGRFVPKKSPESTIRAFAKVVEKHPDARLTFIGDGDLMNSTVDLTKTLNLENCIEFKGVLKPTEVIAELQKHAIFVQHSTRTDENDSEGTPLSILEAASTGLAIVSTNHAGIPDVIENGKSGYLVDEGDIDGMAARMIELFEDEELRKQFGAKARGTVLTKYHQSEYIHALQHLLDEAKVPPKKESKLKVWKTRLVIFLVLFIIAEIGLRIVGYKPGVIEDFYYHRGEIEYDSILYGDEVGITHVVAGAQMIEGGEINSEGFFSSVEFTTESVDAIRKSGKKVVMLIGDSYTQGCCADHFNASFAQLLNESEEYVILNFGIPGADPVQYRLIVEKYAPVLKPDMILIAVYGGNDALEYDRTAKPFIPLTYPIKNGPWLNSEGPIYLTEQGTYFKNFEEAKAHYLEYFSLWGDEASFFEKTIRYSVILSRPYMKWKTKKQHDKIKHQMPKSLERQPYSHQNLDSLNSTAVRLEIPVVFGLIPSPSDVQNETDLSKKYDFIFENLKYHIPTDFQVSDYDGLADANHFNNQGHKKFAAFLTTLIESTIKE